MDVNLFTRVLTFFKNKRIFLFGISAIFYAVFSFIPKEITDEFVLLQCLFIIGFFGPFCLFLYFRWLDENLSQQKRYFSKFLAIFFSAIISVNIIFLAISAF